MPGSSRAWLAGAVLTVACSIAGCQSVPPDGFRAGGQRERAELQTQLGIGYLREGNRETAYKRLQRALALDPTYAPAHHAMALLKEQLNEPEEAAAHYRRAIELDPGASAARTNYGGLLCRHNRYEEAEEQLARAVANPLYDAPERAYYNAGTCMQRKGDLAKAAAYFRKSLSANPRLAPSLIAMSEISLAEGNDLSARGYLQRYLEVGPHTPRSLWLGIQIERALGDKNAASSYAMLLKSKYPDSVETQKLLESEDQ